MSLEHAQNGLKMEDYLGCTVKYASKLLFSGAAIEVLFLFFSFPLYPSTSFFAFAAFSARSNHA